MMMEDDIAGNTLTSLLEENVVAAATREQETFDALAAPFERRIVLHGAGGVGRCALSALRDDGIEPLAFTDASAGKWGSVIDGIPVLSPDAAAARFGRDAAFVVTIAARGGDFLPLAQRLQELGCVKVIPYRPLFWKHPSRCPAHLTNDRPSVILAAKDDIRRAHDLFSDKESRDEFVSQIHWRLWQEFGILRPECPWEQYFPDDIFAPNMDEVFIDVGAFDGDTLRAFLRKYPDFQRFIAMEPDPANFASLEKFVAGLSQENRKKIECKMLCAGAKKSRLRFSSGGGEASQISSHGDVEVECDTLDEILKDKHPTIIKMDIEGAEPDAFRGAGALLGRGKAIWAVCVYHQPEHLWELPLAIRRYSDSYRFFLRKYAGEIWETVCYAVPEARMRASNFLPISFDAPPRQGLES